MKSHLVWNIREPRKNLVWRFIHLYIDEFYDRKLIINARKWELIRGLTVIFNPSTTGTQDNSIMLGQTIEMNWVTDDLLMNCWVLSQEMAHYILWMLGYPAGVWKDKVHERWREDHNNNIIITIRYFDWRKLRYFKEDLRALNVFDMAGDAMQ